MTVPRCSAVSSVKAALCLRSGCTPNTVRPRFYVEGTRASGCSHCGSSRLLVCQTLDSWPCIRLLQTETGLPDSLGWWHRNDDINEIVRPVITAVWGEVEGSVRTSQTQGMAEKDRADVCPWMLYVWGSSSGFNALCEVLWVADQTLEPTAVRLQGNRE